MALGSDQEASQTRTSSPLLSPQSCHKTYRWSKAKLKHTLKFKKNNEVCSIRFLETTLLCTRSLLVSQASCLYRGWMRSVDGVHFLSHASVDLQVLWYFNLRVNWGESVYVHVICVACVCICCLCSHVDHMPVVQCAIYIIYRTSNSILFYFGDI